MREFETFPNLVTMFFTRATELGDAPFLWHREGKAWKSRSWTQTALQVAALSEGLKRLGIERGDRVMLVSENRPEWCVADLAIMAAGAITVPTYTTNTERDHLHILQDSGAKAVIVSTAKLARTLMPAVIRSTQCRTVIGIEDLKIGQSGDVAFHDWAKMLSTEMADPQATAASCDFKREDLACIIYTSGTGGSPRGVQQHHGAILHNVEGCLDIFIHDFGWGDEVFLSFLPLSHAYEHSGGQFLPIGLGGQIYYSEGLEKLASNIEEVRPTVMVVVPRLFEVLRARIVKTIEKQGGLAPKLLQRAQDFEGSSEIRWPHEGLGVGRRAAQPGCWRLLSRARPAPDARLWPDRVRSGHIMQSPQRGHQDGYGRPADEEHRGQNRRGRRNPGPRRAGHARLLEQSGGNGAGAG
jgi:long-chain acyl-CoA synthetase